MMEKRQFYIESPSGDLVLVEVYRNSGEVTVVLAETIRLHLDRESALELSEELVLAANDMF